MIDRRLAGLLLAAALLAPSPSFAQAEPSLPAWNWDDPMGHKSNWIPVAAAIAGVIAVGVAADLYFHWGVTPGLYRTFTAGGGGGGGGYGGAAAAH
ncbi:MAG: hypothetical protein GC191_20425 [Azospirillum sp.]|nr:hypothetical protein [Azospirillum sp.]